MNKKNRVLKKLSNQCKKISQLEPLFERLTDEELKRKINELREIAASGKHSINELTNESFALVREVSRRTIGKRHFDSQIVGGLALSKGSISEMNTGEGKTLISTLPAFLYSILGQKIHIVTVNDYLAERDAKIVSPIFDMLGVTVGVIKSNTSPESRSAAYEKDITYGTSAEFGFDYLRDNMCQNKEEIVQKGHDLCIIDEIDSVLIDEARTPLVISGSSAEDPESYKVARSIANQFIVSKSKDSEGVEPLIPNCDAILNEKSKKVVLTEDGYRKCELIFVQEGILLTEQDLYTNKGLSWVHLIVNSLNSEYAYTKNTDYIVRDGEVQIIDPNTGRVMIGRRWGDGIHQSVEAKEDVDIKPESITLGSISIQNYFKLYTKISGMTGTASTEEAEFAETYGVGVITIPPNKPCKRIDERDQLFLNENAKVNAVITDIKDCYQRGQPVLVGTTSVAKSEELSLQLNKLDIPHQVLNAKYHDREAQIISEAGRLNSVTIATNMAGRGTDIILGGNIEDIIKLGISEDEFESSLSSWEENHNAVIEAGGLRVISTERHDSRRVDNQLRGRSGRQGDPGSTVFYLSMEDRLLRIFGADRFKSLFERMGFGEDDAIEHRFVDKAISDAQKKIEGMGYEARRELVKYDTVLDQQRHIVYDLRKSWLTNSDSFELAQGMLRYSLDSLLVQFIPHHSFVEQWGLEDLQEEIYSYWGFNVDAVRICSELDTHDDAVARDMIADEFMSEFNKIIPPVNSEIILRAIKTLALRTLDHQWQQLIEALDHVKEGIHLRSYANKTPVQEFQIEAKKLFESMLSNLQLEFSQQFVFAMHDLSRIYNEQAA